MKNLLAATLVSLLALAAAGAARAQVQPPPPPAPTPMPITQGRLEGDTYTNDYFGFSFNVPKGWVSQDAAARQAIMKTGQEIVTDGAPGSQKAAIQAAIARTAILLSAWKYAPGTPAPGFNAQVACIAERVPSAVVKTGEDYLRLMIQTAQGTSAKLELDGPMRRETVGGVTFAAADMKASVAGYPSAHKAYVTIKKGYAILFSFTYVDEEDAQAYAEVIKSLKFK